MHKIKRFLLHKAFLFMLPALVVLGVFVLYPLILAIWYSFTDYYLLKPHDINFVGLKNYVGLTKDTYAKQAFINSGKYTLLIVPFQLGISLVLALLIAKRSKVNTFLRTAFFSPYILSIIVVSLLWKMILDPNKGIVNAFLEQFNIDPIHFFSSTELALPTIAFIIIWQGISFQMLILIAALQDIPRTFYEVAKIEGANTLETLWYVTLPSIKEKLIFILIIATTGALKIIIEPMVITNGGPQGSTTSVLLYMYKQGTRYRQVGIASTITVVFAIILLFVAVLQKKLIGRERT